MQAGSAYLTRVLDLLPQFICLLSPDHSIQATNRRFRELFGDGKGHQCFEAIRGRSEPCANCPLEEVFEKRSATSPQCFSISNKTYELSYHPFETPDGSPMVLALGTDISERVHAERSLTMERDRLQGILDAMKDSVYIVGSQHEVLYCNAAMAKELGPVRGRKCYEYLHARGRPCPWCPSAQDLAGETVRREWTADSSGRAYETVTTPMGDIDGSCLKLHILHDITDRRRAEDALRESTEQLRSLSQQLLQTQETERRQISRQLHDVLAQALGTLKLRLSLIRNQLDDGQNETRADCNETIYYLDHAIETVRRLSRELSPTVLEDLGLGTALRRLVTQFSQHNQVEVVSQIDDSRRLPSKDEEFVLYRIFQEALNNVQRHANARKVSVVLEIRDREVRGLVKDDGVGFVPAEVVKAGAAEKGMGMAVTAERVRILGGTLDISSEPGKGTSVRFSYPTQR